MMIVITHQFVCVEMKLFEMIILGSIKNVWPTISLDLHNVYLFIYFVKYDPLVNWTLHCCNELDYSKNK